MFKISVSSPLFSDTSNVLKTSTAAMDQTTISYSTNRPDEVPMETPDADELRVSQTLTKREGVMIFLVRKPFLLSPDCPLGRRL